jgi:hypothetical protein
MIKRGICPACGSNEVHTGASIGRKGGVNGSHTIAISWFDIVMLDNYVCVNCGYVESYIGDPNALRRIAKKWPKVGM